MGNNSRKCSGSLNLFHREDTDLEGRHPHDLVDLYFGVLKYINLMNTASLLLQKKIKQAFSQVEQPSPEKIVDCDCWECVAQKKIFSGQDKENLSEELIEKCDTIALFSNEAFQYFLPCFLIYSLNHLEDNEYFAKYVLNTVLPDNTTRSYWLSRLELFSEEQLKVVIEYIDYMRGKPDIFYDQVAIEKGKIRLEKYFSISKETKTPKK